MNFNFIILAILIFLLQPGSAIFLTDINNSSNIIELYPGINMTLEEATYLLAFSAETPNVTQDGIVTFRNGLVWKIT